MVSHSCGHAPRLAPGFLLPARRRQTPSPTPSSDPLKPGTASAVCRSNGRTLPTSWTRETRRREGAGLAHARAVTL